jgi:hypothetical protein
MPRQAQVGKRPTRHLGVQLRLGACAAAASALCWLAGCQTAPAVQQPGKGDPIVGEWQEKGFTIPSPPGNTKGTKAATNSLPPYPRTTEAGAHATIVGDLPPSNLIHTLAIDDGKRPSAQTTGGWQPATDSWSPTDGDPLAPGGPTSLNRGQNMSAPPAVSVGQPQAIVVPLGPAPGAEAATPNTAFGSPVAAVGSYDALQARLKAHKVTYQCGMNFGDGYKFTCKAPHPQDPNRVREYEAIARDDRSAILAVLEQMDLGR